MILFKNFANIFEMNIAKKKEIIPEISIAIKIIIISEEEMFFSISLTAAAVPVLDLFIVYTAT